MFILSWYHWSDTTWLRSIQRKYARITTAIQSRANDAIESSSASFRDEELSFLDDKSNGSEIDDISGDGNSSKDGKDYSADEEQRLRQRGVAKKAF